jgi:OOP family OmpA-OmpF porin
MNTTLSKRVILCFGFCIGATSGQLHAVSDIKAAPANGAYVQDARGNIARTPSGMCWRTGFWTPADAVPGCDGPLLPPIAKPTAPELVPPPLVQASPSPVLPKRCDFSVTLENEQLFAFDKAELNMAASKRLEDDVLPLFAACATLDSVIVTGHTDRIGSDTYNQKLSEKRAVAVASYLKSKGVAAEITTRGAGEKQAVSSCDAGLSRNKLIRCLAQDRRVTIEAQGVAR